MVPDASALRVAMDQYLAQGYVVAAQDHQSSTMVRRKEFSVPIAIVGFLFCVIGLLVYLIVYSSQSDSMVRLIVNGTPQGALSADGQWRWSGSVWLPVPAAGSPLPPPSL